ncbi:hypothetical protein [Oceaniovalibus sp. ACAM 378]|uniref:hypothetical protein n=1 Tax=Oceaniovalibus sp. ACAM 378 TaxID=2599923 RepID=UPI0011D5CC1C|nr:hypothetical protein [Oceaniovalibus sp. ACAM 378]TYB87073.1 hypothetical protein FQ320_14680 [Oceaniovalibus sp. ACAM 378]
MTPREQADEIAGLIGTRLGVGGNGLDAKVKKAGRLLPRRIRRDAELLSDAARISEHPRLSRMANPTDTTRAYRDCKRFLIRIDGSERIVRFALGLVTANAFNFLAVSAVLIGVLVWRGYL